MEVWSHGLVRRPLAGAPVSHESPAPPVRPGVWGLGPHRVPDRHVLRTCRGCRANFALPGRGAAPHTSIHPPSISTIPFHSPSVSLPLFSLSPFLPFLPSSLLFLPPLFLPFVRLCGPSWLSCFPWEPRPDPPAHGLFSPWAKKHLRRDPGIWYLMGRSAGVIQWQNRSFPCFLRGFDSLRPLHTPSGC